ncbi:MAG: Hpt domain-containing protein [Planctomycetota bacterium]
MNGPDTGGTTGPRQGSLDPNRGYVEPTRSREARFRNEMESLREEFRRELPSRAGRIAEALIARDGAAVSRYAHQLKGAAAVYGYTAIADAAMAILEESSKACLDWHRLTKLERTLTDLCRMAEEGQEDIS